MKENNNNLVITRDSLEKNKFISENMEGSTFHLHTHILYDIRTHLGEELKNYLEIGSYAGGSMSLVSSHKYPTKCITVDLGEPIDKTVVESNVLKFKNPNSEFKYVQGNSQDINIINKVKNECNEFDFLFIDGDHTTLGVILDFQNYLPLVKKGGYICFDDYLDYQFSPDVKGAVDYIVQNLNKNEYNIIGSLSYEYLNEFTEMKSNNIFIIQKLNN
jgi:cephalosporin hydroxylase